ncbi:MAG: phosphoglycerate dehydrogenase [Pirellulales bacterium]|nr:phosphoglycerate dehydrogenase [Pirellulales bacterium]
MPRVMVFPFMLKNQPGPYRDILERAGFEVVYPQDNSAVLANPEALVAELQGIDAALAGMEPFNARVLAGSQLRVVSRMGVGYDAVDVPSASELGVAVCIAPGTNQDSVAEQTIALMFGVARGFPGRDQEVRSGQWKRQSLPRLAGRTLGLVGLGRIGRAVVPRAVGLGLKVIACDPCADPEFVRQSGVRLVSFDELLAEADIVSLHAPACAETNDLINRDTLARMKRGSILINTARGNLVDEDALAEAIASGHLFGAGLDAFKIEPLPLDSPLLKVDRVLLAPHMGGLDLESEVAMSSLAAQCIVDLHEGRWPEGCVVNEQIRSGWQWR